MICSSLNRLFRIPFSFDGGELSFYDDGISGFGSLGPAWKHVGLGWHPWDLQLGTGRDRLRLQVKQTAARQLWGLTKSHSLSFGWKSHAPAEFDRYNPGETIESEGWFCEGFVFGIHDGTDPAKIDQVDPAQWQFMVIAAADLMPGTKTMRLSRARRRWQTVAWDGLAGEVTRLIERVRGESLP